MSGSRKEFDVKQILKIRWRWFGHQQSTPKPSIDCQPGDFWDRGHNATTGGIKFLNPGTLPLPFTSIGFPKSNQQAFQNSPSWPMASSSEVPTFEITPEDCEGAHWLERPYAEDGASEEENVSDSSSCRLLLPYCEKLVVPYIYMHKMGVGDTFHCGAVKILNHGAAKELEFQLFCSVYIMFLSLALQTCIKSISKEAGDGICIL